MFLNISAANEPFFRNKRELYNGWRLKEDINQNESNGNVNKDKNKNKNYTWNSCKMEFLKQFDGGY